MCACNQPTINGQPGYSWDGHTVTTHQVNPPELINGDVLIFDEPGRCGKIDAHCHHFRLVYNGRSLFLLVANGLGTKRIPLSNYGSSLVDTLSAVDSDARFWILRCIHSTVRNMCTATERDKTQVWATAFLSKRIKKQKRNGTYRVWIDDTTAATK
jgi:hypothetical protein